MIKPGGIPRISRHGVSFADILHDVFIALVQKNLSDTTDNHQQPVRQTICSFLALLQPSFRIYRGSRIHPQPTAVVKPGKGNDGTKAL